MKKNKNVIVPKGKAINKCQHHRNQIYKAAIVTILHEMKENTLEINGKADLSRETAIIKIL